MLAPFKSWADAANVQKLLSRIQPSDFRRGSQMQNVGPDAAVWVNNTDRGYRILIALEAIYNKAIIAKHGTFAEAWADGGEHAANLYLIAVESEPTVQDALASVLGNPFYVEAA